MIRMTLSLSILFVSFAFCSARAAAPPAPESQTAGKLTVSTDFPSGSAEVISIDQRARSIRLMPTLHKDRGWRCWWCVKIAGCRPGETLTVTVGDAPWATPDRAALSHDNQTWGQTEKAARRGKLATYKVKAKGPAFYLAWGPPFTPDDARRLVESAAKQSPHATAYNLCDTRGGRATPALRIMEGPHSADRYGIWINARQHAWESGSSWVCRGLIEWLVSDDPRAAALRKQAEIHIVPVMDIDNVAIGAGGKNQRPHDHNRDWSDRPHWRSVAAATERIKKLHAAGRFDLFIDLHNPGAGSRDPFFYIAPRKLLSKVGMRNLDRFLTACRQEMTGPLAFRGKTHESGPNYDKNWRRISKNWVMENTGEHVVALTLETAWNTPHSTTDGYRTVGKQLGLAVERYLRQPPRETKERRK